MLRAERSKDNYKRVFEPIRRARMAQMEGRQPIRQRAAQVLLDLVAMDKPPVHLLLGNAAPSALREKSSALSIGIDIWESVLKSTGFFLARPRDARSRCELQAIV